MVTASEYSASRQTWRATQNREATYAQEEQHTGPYTGVVLIHGIGREKRNETMQEVLNALTYWYNHTAGLALRPTGPGRVWLDTQLTENDDPDAPSSTATLTLAAPISMGGAAAPDLRIRFREVWWAQSFGLPSTSAALAWARIQFRQEALRILLPIRAHIGQPDSPRRRSAAAASGVHGPGENPAHSFGGAQHDADRAIPRAAHTNVGRLRRALLRVVLSIYDLAQDIWKSIAWVVVAPLILLLLLLVGLLRPLTLLPGAGNLLKGLEAVVDAVMLYWIASMQVYLLDYMRSTSIRQRFEREVNVLLRDPQCERVVVLAHSMGTVLAYEGLASALAAADPANANKPVTFICLAQALRRIWLLSRTDPHRVRGVLPPHVRWLHFWGRYDPVAAGPLLPSTLPTVRDWTDESEADPDAALRESLRRCVNIAVVNNDSIFYDHTTYWQNIEQVVGPIAHELVSHHPTLERTMEAHLANEDDVLLRRFGVGWRSTVAQTIGLLAGLLTLWLGAQDGMRLGRLVRVGIVNALGDLLGGIVGFLSLRPAMASLGQQIDHLRGSGDVVGAVLRALAGLGRTAPPIIDLIVTVLVALAIVAIVVGLLSQRITLPSPYVFRGPEDRVRVRSVRPGAPSATKGAAQPDVEPVFVPPFSSSSTEP